MCIKFTWKTRLGDANTKLASTSASFLRSFSVAFVKAILPSVLCVLRRLFRVPLTSSSFSIRRIWSLKDAAWVLKDTKLAGWDSRGSELGSSTINAWKSASKRLYYPIQGPYFSIEYVDIMDATLIKVVKKIFFEFHINSCLTFVQKKF